MLPLRSISSPRPDVQKEGKTHDQKPQPLGAGGGRDRKPQLQGGTMTKKQPQRWERARAKAKTVTTGCVGAWEANIFKNVTVFLRPKFFFLMSRS